MDSKFLEVKLFNRLKFASNIMHFYLAFVTFFICCDIFTAFPHSNSFYIKHKKNKEKRGVLPLANQSKDASSYLMEDPSSWRIDVISYGYNLIPCFLTERICDSFGSECESEPEFDYNIDRIPQLLSQVKCKSPTRIPRRYDEFRCEDITYPVPFVYKTNETAGFKWTIHNISIGCIKVKTPLSMLIDIVKYSNNPGLYGYSNCPAERIGDSLGSECESVPDFDYRINRIPELLSEVKCKEPKNNLQAGFQCKNLIYPVPFMYETNETSIFKWAVNNISIGCVKVKTSPS